MTRIPESDSHRYAGARPPDRRRTCPEIVAASAIIVAAASVSVAAIVDDAVADSVVVPVAVVTPAAAAAAAAALLGSARANIAVQRYILGPACGIGIGACRRQETHDFLSSISERDLERRSLPCDVSRARRDATLSSLSRCSFAALTRRRRTSRGTTGNNRFLIIIYTSVIISDRSKKDQSFFSRDANFKGSCR